MIKSVLITCFLMVIQMSSSLAQIYARLEITNVSPTPSPGVIQTLGQAYIRYYSDPWCTTPTTLPNDMLFNLTIDYDSDIPNNGGWLDPHTYGNQGYANTSETDLGSWLVSEDGYHDNENTQQRYWVTVNGWIADDGNNGNSYIAVSTITY